MSAVHCAMRTTCRGCGGSDLRSVMDYGLAPLADRLLPADAPEEEPRYPLELVWCPTCALAQITADVPPEVLFDAAFPYHSRFSASLVASFEAHAGAIIAARARGTVVEIGSNDASQLRPFARAGWRVLGIDPARGPAEYAESIGVPTRRAFFDDALAHDLARQGWRADVVIAKNVLAHAADPNAVLRGVRTLLDRDAVAVFEFPSVIELLDRGAFDTVYHEHRCCLSATALAPMLARAGLRLERVEPIELHGGSLRVTASAGEGVAEPAAAWLEHERVRGVRSLERYLALRARARAIAERVRAMVDEARARGERVAAYGAAAKGAIMLHLCGLSAHEIDFVADRNDHKHGRRMPGARVPILPASALAERRPHLTLVLAWNFLSEILREQHPYARAGGRFLVPIPEPRIIFPGVVEL